MIIIGFFVDDNIFKTLVIIGEASINVTKKGSRKPVIVIRSSYEHELGDINKTRSRHRAGIKLKKGNVYGKEGLEVFITDEKGNVNPTISKNSSYDEKRDEKLVIDFIKKYYNEIDRIYNTKPGTKEYEEAINSLLNKGKNDEKYNMKRDDKNEK